MLNKDYLQLFYTFNFQTPLVIYILKIIQGFTKLVFVFLTFLLLKRKSKTISEIYRIYLQNDIMKHEMIS